MLHLLVILGGVLSSLIVAYILSPSKASGRFVCHILTDFLTKCVFAARVKLRDKFYDTQKKGHINAIFSSKSDLCI